MSECWEASSIVESHAHLSHGPVNDSTTVSVAYTRHADSSVLLAQAAPTMMLLLHRALCLTRAISH